MTVDKLKRYEDIVKPILVSDVRAREDDWYLYGKVLYTLYPELETIPKHDLFLWHKQLGLPSYESVTRTRRRLQRKYPDLASERVRQKRLEEQEVYKEYARTS